VLNYNTIKKYTKIKYKDYLSLKKFIIGFKQAIDKLTNLNISPPNSWHPILFIIALSDTWPIWAERQHLNTHKESTKLTLSALIKDITDKARNKDKKANSGTALYSSKPNPDKKQKKTKDTQKDSEKDKKKGKKCKHCHNSNALHKPKCCFVKNKKL
jgi:hypothetical protein